MRKPLRLQGPALVATGPATVYTVPALTKTILRHIHIQNPSAAIVTLSLSIGADAAATRIIDALPIPALAPGSFDNMVDSIIRFII